MLDLIQRLEQRENEVIEQFRRELQLLPSLTDQEFNRVLLDKRMQALHGFEPFYNTAICSLENEEAKQIARGIVLEEYPAGQPNHREDAVYDLISIGIPRERILRTELSEGTKSSISALLELVTYDGSGHYDVRAVTALRVAGEVLPGEEFLAICNELERRYNFTKDKSRFYWPHLGHDQKTTPLGEYGTSHADRFGKVLAQIATSEAKLQVATKSMNDSCEARSIFYGQFSFQL